MRTTPTGPPGIARSGSALHAIRVGVHTILLAPWSKAQEFHPLKLTHARSKYVVHLDGCQKKVKSVIIKDACVVILGR